MEIKLPYKIGEDIYIVEDYYNYDCLTENENTKATVTKAKAEGYILDKEGIHLAELDQDGWTEVAGRGLTINGDYGECKVFKDFKKAKDYANKINKE